MLEYNPHHWHVGLVLVLALAACGAPTPRPAPQAPPVVVAPATATAPTASEILVDAGDVQLWVRTLGKPDSETTVVALHGGPGISHEYMHAFERLNNTGTIRVVTYDQRGIGRSTSPEDPAALSFEVQAHDLERIRVALGTDKIDIISHSYGGPLAMAYAIIYPQHVRSLVFVDSMPPKFNDYNAGIWYLSEEERALQYAGVIVDPLPPVEGDDCSKRVIAELPAYFHDKTHPMTKHLAGSTCQADIGSRTRAANQWYDFTEALAAVEAPTIIYYGESDPFRLQMSQAINNAMPNAKPQLIKLDRCGHVPFEECPEPFFRNLRAFLAARP